MKNLKHLFLLLVSPQKTWQKTEQVPGPIQLYLNQFLYPFIGVVALAAMSQYFVFEITLSRALQLTMAEVAKFFGGFYALTYAMQYLHENVWKVVLPEARIKYFVGQLLCLFMLLDIALYITQIFVALPFVVKFLPLLWGYVIWGSKSYMEIPEQKGLPYVVITTLLFWAIPFTIYAILEAIMPTV